MSNPKILILIFATALVLRLLYIYEIADNPFFSSPVVDAYTYAQQARVIAAGHWLDYTPEPFWQPPLYPWLTGAVYALGGQHFFLTIRLVQALFGAASCLLLYLLGCRLFEWRIALAAACALALYGPAIYFDGELLPASIAVLFFLIVALTVLNAAAREHALCWTVPGFLLGLAALNVATILIALPCLVVWIYIGAERRAKQKGLRLLCLCAGLLLAIAPVTLHNYFISGDFVLISWNAGVNFYLGNNPDYPATVHIRPGQAWLDLVGRARAAGFADGAQNSAFFFAQSLDYMRSQPLDYARVLAAKFTALWDGGEIVRNQNIYYFRNYSDLLYIALWKNVLAFPFGLVGPLAIVGFCRCRGRPQRLLAGLVLSYAAGIVLFFVTARYRLPLIPFSLLFAASAVYQLTDEVRHRRRAGFWWGGSALLLAVWTNWSVGAMDMSGDAEHYYNLGHAHIEKNRLAEGIRALEKAADMAGKDADILFSLGTAYSFSGQYRRAETILMRAAQLHPDRMDIRLNLGNAHFSTGRYHQAAAEYLAVLEVHPRDIVPLRGAARALARSGQEKAAIVHYEQFQRLKPSDLESYIALGYFYSRSDKNDAALTQFSGALKLDPRHLTALLETGRLHLARGDAKGALTFLQRAVRHHPGNSQVHIHLGEAFEMQRQWGKALAAYRKALGLEPGNSAIRERLARLARQTTDGERDQ